jgi:dTMP kinase
MTGTFIVFEGIDGCGKTTQIGLLEGVLSKHHHVVRLREPGGTPIGERIREVLLDARHAEMSPMTEFLLYMASRAQLVEETIRPALKRGRVVLLDRYYFSTAAYQGAAGKLGVDYVLDFAEETCRFPQPDLVVVLDVDPAEAARRSMREKDRVEAKGLAYQRKVRAAYLAMAKRDPKRFRVVKASGSIDTVHPNVVEVVTRALR